MGSTLIGRLLLYDAMQMKFQEFKVRRNPKCPLCSENPTITKLIDYDQFCGVHPPQPEVLTVSASEITVQELKRRIDAGDNLTIIDVRNPEEFEICRIPGRKLLPLPELAKRFGELDSTKEIILHCKSGGRSGKAQQFLRGSQTGHSPQPKGRHSWAWANEIAHKRYAEVTKEDERVAAKIDWLYHRKNRRAACHRARDFIEANRDRNAWIKRTLPQESGDPKQAATRGFADSEQDHCLQRQRKSSPC